LLLDPGRCGIGGVFRRECWSFNNAISHALALLAIGMLGLSWYLFVRKRIKEIKSWNSGYVHWAILFVSCGVVLFSDRLAVFVGISVFSVKKDISFTLLSKNTLQRFKHS